VASDTPAPTPTPTPTPTTPLALAVHPTTPPLDLTPELAQQLLRGTVTDWSALGLAPGPLRLVAAPTVEGVPPAVRTADAAAAVDAAAADPSVVAAVPAPAADPSVRTLTVAGSHPLRSPATYPLTTPGEPPPVKPTVVTTVGDIMLARRVGRVAAQAGDPALPLRRTAERLAAADIAIGNFESTLARLGGPTQDDAFAADPSMRAGLTLAGFDVLSLGNNHVGDFGPESLLETVRLIRETGIQTTGAGATLAEASAPVVVERDGVRIGVLAFDAIGETPAATPTSPGAFRLRMEPRTGPLQQADLDAVLAGVRTLATQADVVLVVPHWGTQYTTELVPDQQLVARALVDAGADVVLGGHPHWVQGAEAYGEGFIAYSLGNFVFDMTFMQQTQEAVVLDLVLWGDDVVAAEFAPVRISPDDFAPRVVDPVDGAPILTQLWDASVPPYGLRR
jgi:poly-gamma-glutamate synthesis protein (capsule biosynthesis protein)